MTPDAPAEAEPDNRHAEPADAGPSAGQATPHLDPQEQRQAERHAPPTPLVIHEVVRDEGEAELTRSLSALGWSGLAAGLSMGFSFLTMALLTAHLPPAPWHIAAAAPGYSLGFVIVILGRQQLFTESTLTAVLPVLVRWDRRSLLALLRLWAVVLAANLIGTFGFAALLTVPDIVRPETRAALDTLGHEVFARPLLPAILKAMLAGWLIALMVWLLPAARSARLLVIALLTTVVALAQLPHIIAGSTEAAYAVLMGLAPPGDYVLVFLLPTLLGNTVGGVALAALLNHAPLAETFQKE